MTEPHLQQMKGLDQPAQADNDRNRRHPKVDDPIVWMTIHERLQHLLKPRGNSQLCRRKVVKVDDSACWHDDPLDRKGVVFRRQCRPHLVKEQRS